MVVCIVLKKPHVLSNLPHLIGHLPDTWSEHLKNAKMVMLCHIHWKVVQNVSKQLGKPWTSTVHDVLPPSLRANKLLDRVEPNTATVKHAAYIIYITICQK